MKILHIGEQCYRIVPATADREWINLTDKASHKCKPMREASKLGWLVLLPFDIQLYWDGGTKQESLSISSSDPMAKKLVVSHFGYGMVSIIFNFIVRTPPGVHILVSGPLNQSRGGVAPLSALIETDWLPYHFAITYRCIQPNARITIHRNEAIAQIIPVSRGIVDRMELSIGKIDDDPEMERDFSEWHIARQADAAQYAVDGQPRKPLGFYDRRELPGGRKRSG